MAIRLGEHVVSGEIFNTTHYSVHGWLELRGREQPLVLQLTGNCSPDLAGWHFRFEARPTMSLPPAGDDSEELDSLATQQIGPTGTMTAGRGAVWHGAEPNAAGRSDAAKSKQPGRRLYLEWFSQNGHIVIELANAAIEFVEYKPLLGDSPASDTPGLAPREPVPGERATDDASTTAGAHEGSAFEGDGLFADVQSNEDEDADPYSLLPRDLQLQFDMEANETDWNLQNDEDKPQVIREMELMDNLIENSDGVPLSDLFDGPQNFPLPDQLDDQQVETALKELLAQLALYGVALDVCQHFSPRETYRLLLQEICPEERAYPELRHTQWVQHHSTSDYCERCQSDVDQQYNQPQEGDWSGPEDPDDETEF